ncbi:MAG: amino acid ABC transporter substrate-binding protein [Desulfovibrio sp.]|nr:amino acid ABC transporter substrate-binding protein [Desulfovibrio sp.]
MKKLFFLCCLLALTILPCQLMAKTYVNGIDPNYPPFAYVDEKTGQPAGFDVDSLNWIAKTMGFSVTHKPMAWDGIIPALKAGEIDLICSGMSVTTERAKVVLFSKPYWQVWRVFVAKKNSTLTVQDILSKKIQLGVQRGTSEAAALKKEQKEKGYPLTFRYYDSAPLAIEDVLNGRIDAAFMDELPADDAIAKGALVKKIGTYGLPDDFGVAMRMSDLKLRQLIDEGYKKLMADPYWEELKKKYMNK